MGEPPILEGTGEELERYLKQAPKRRFRLISLTDLESDIPEDRAGQGQSDAAQTASPNEKALAALREIAERQKHRPYTDGSDTLRLLREARAGAMYGYDPSDG